MSGYVLRCLLGRDLRVVPLPDRGSLTIGRGANSELQLSDGGLSRQHARIHVNESVFVEDLGSANGTFVSSSIAVHDAETGTHRHDRQRVEPGIRFPLNPGDTLHLGAAVCVLSRARETSADTLGPIVADSAMTSLYAMIDAVAESPLNVLIVGETGVGKEVLAETVVRRSARSNKPFVRLNCAAFQHSLLESELFGYERGAFTGAVKAKPGLIENADGGSVLLDEISEVPPPIQAKLLRVLEAQEVQRIGALSPRHIDVRFLAASNRDLAEEVRAGRFRADLFFRLNGFMLSVPPLRERPADVAALAREFAHRAAKARGKEGELTPEVLALFGRYAWPGNVRELKNVVERAVALAGGAPIQLEHLPPEIRSSTHATRAAPHAPEAYPSFAPTLPPPASADPERDQILRALERCSGNQTRAAKLLGISRNTLIARLDRYGVPRPRK